MHQRVSMWFSWVYWLTLITMVCVSVLGSQAVIKSDDFTVYLLAKNVAPYNTNWVEVIRDKKKPETTALMVNIPGTSDNANMRYIEYVTHDLTMLGRDELKKLIQSDTEASVKGGKTHGKLVTISSEYAQMLYIETQIDLLLLSLSFFSMPEAGFLLITTLITQLRHFIKGRGKSALVVFTYWAKMSYFLSFLCMCAALWLISFPVLAPLVKWLTTLL